MVSVRVITNIYKKIVRDHETSFTMNKLYIIFFTLAFATTETAFAKSSSSKVFEVSDWSVFAEANPKQCWATTIPSNSITSRNSKKVKVKRNDVALMVVLTRKQGSMDNWFTLQVIRLHPVHPFN